MLPLNIIELIPCEVVFLFGSCKGPFTQKSYVASLLKVSHKTLQGVSEKLFDGLLFRYRKMMLHEQAQRTIAVSLRF